MTEKLFSWTGAIVLCSAMAAPAQTIPSRTSPTGSVLNKRVRDSAAAMLAKHVDSVDWVDTTFEEIIDWMRDISNDEVNIIPRWTALEVDSVGPESLVTLKLSNVLVYEVLNEVLIQLSEDDTLDYQAVRNTLKISTKQDLNKRLYVRIYDATDILHHVFNFGEESPKIDLQRTASTSGGGGGQSVFSGGSSGGGGSSRGGQQAEQDMEDKLEELKTLIQASTAPSTWAATGTRGAAATAGAGLGTISIFNRSLVIYATPEVHELIAGHFEFGG